MTNDPKIWKMIYLLNDAANYQNGARFEEGKSLPEELLHQKGSLKISSSRDAQ